MPLGSECQIENPNSRNWIWIPHIQEMNIDWRPKLLKPPETSLIGSRIREAIFLGWMNDWNLCRHPLSSNYEGPQTYEAEDNFHNIITSSKRFTELHSSTQWNCFTTKSILKVADQQITAIEIDGKRRLSDPRAAFLAHKCVLRKEEACTLHSKMRREREKYLTRIFIKHGSPLPQSGSHEMRYWKYCINNNPWLNMYYTLGNEWCIKWYLM